MSTPSAAQVTYMEDIKVQIDNENCREMVFMPTFTYKSGTKPNDDIVRQFYLKPVVVIAPHLLMLSNLKCTNCKANGVGDNNLTLKGLFTFLVVLSSVIISYDNYDDVFKNMIQGWHDKVRYVHGLKSGWYVLQKNYFCKTCKTKLTGEMLLEESEQIPDLVKLQIPVIFQRRSAVHRELANYIVSDAITAKTFDEIGSVISTFRASEYLEKRTLYYALCDDFTKLENQGIERSLQGRTEFTPTVLPSFSAFDDPKGYNEVLQPTETFIIDFFKGTNVYVYFLFVWLLFFVFIMFYDQRFCRETEVLDKNVHRNDTSSSSFIL